MHKITTIIIIALLIFATDVYSQRNFQSYLVDNGLSQSVVKCVFQDSEGFIWIGTQDGLNKFDGYRFTKYINNPQDTNSISDNWIYSIAEDNNGFLWIGTRNGLQKFDKQSRKFSHFVQSEINNGLKSNVVYGVAKSTENTIIINTPPVLSIYNTNTGNFKHYTNNEIKTDGAILDEKLPVCVHLNKIWLATPNGLSCFDTETKTFTTYKADISNPASLSDNFITSIKNDKQGNIWIGTQNGLNIKKEGSDEFFIIKNNPNDSNSLSYNFVRSILPDSYGNLWIGTDGGGLNLLSKKNLRKRNFLFTRFNSNQNNISSISHDIVLELFEDKSHVLWLGTLQGLNKTDLKPKKFGIIKKSEYNNSVNLLDNVIASIFKTHKNEIWIGNWGKGLNIYNRQTGKTKHYSTQLTGRQYIPNDFVHLIFRDSKKQMWIGTRNGVLIYNENNESFTPAHQIEGWGFLPAFENNRVFEIVEDHRNILWFATQNGLYEINGATKKVKLHKAGEPSQLNISDNLIYELHLDSKNRLWIGTTNGLDCYDIDTGKVRHYTRKQGKTNTLCDNFIVSLNEDSNGYIWIGTKSGANRLNISTNTFEYFSEKDGLMSNVIYEILRDNNGQMWFATGRGLSKFNAGKQSFRTYTLSDGLQSLEFNTACHLAYDGEVFFGGMQGVNYFYPDSLSDNQFAPNVVITHFEAENDAGKQIINISGKQHIELEHNYFAFNFQFAALEFTHPEKNSYKYQMQGVSNEWIDIGTRNFVPFANLPPGKYVFSVKGANNDKVWNKKPATIRITILPPWWLSKWAYFSYFIILILIIFGIIKFRERNLKRERRILENKVQQRTAEIEKQKQVIEKKNNDITASISYASRIQSALLPPHEVIAGFLPDYFILFKPREIVSGDFYWIKNVGSKKQPEYIIVAADCTGHGVPGAFMSMLGVALLNEITAKGANLTAAEILEELRLKVKHALRQTGKDGEAKDGMDIALCIYNPLNLTIQYAGAYNPFYVISDNELNEIKGTRSPIGIYIKEKKFENHTVQLKHNDVFYIFSDGYFDQASHSDQKFKVGRFKSLLMDIYTKPMNQQRETLNRIHNEWKGTTDQTDDIVIIGVRCG